MRAVGNVAGYTVAVLGALVLLTMIGYTLDEYAMMVFSEETYNQQGSAGRDAPSSAGRPSSPDHQRTTGDR